MNRFFWCAMAAVVALASAHHAEAKPTANEQVVLDFIDGMDQMTHDNAPERARGLAERYWTPDCVQHRAGVAPGREAFIKSISALPMDPASQARRATSPPIKTLSITTVEDRVILVRRMAAPDANSPTKLSERYVFNVYRVQDGKIAENWWAVSAAGT